MPIYIDTIPYMSAKNRKVALPRTSPTNQKHGFGNLVFLFSNSLNQSIHMMNNKMTCYHDNKYRYYYYNLHYLGSIANRRYNIKDVEERKNVYKKIQKETSISPHPPSLLSSTPNRNTYYEMVKYNQIFEAMTKHLSPARKMQVFWTYYRSIWFSTQTQDYETKIVLLDADYYSTFKGDLKTLINNPLFMIYYTLYKNYALIQDLDIEFVIYCKTMVLRLNPSKADEKSYLLFKRELGKVFNKQTGLESLKEEELEKEEQKELIKEELIQKYNFVGEEPASTVTSLTDIKEPEKKPAAKAVEKKVEEKLAQASKEVEPIVPDDKEASNLVQVKAEIALEEDKDLIENMYKAIAQEKVPTKPLSTARDAEMRRRQEALEINHLTMKDLENINAAKRPVPVKDLTPVTHTLNNNMKKLTYNNINKDYIDNVMTKDILDVFKSLNNKPYKFYVQNVTVKDTSNELNYKDTYHITLKDMKGQRHEVTFDIPKFLDYKFMYLGGNKKIIDKQNFLFPVVKTSPDTVQIVTNYNKMFIRRLGTKSISSVQRILKMMTANEEALTYFTTGSCSMANNTFITTIEYDEFAKIITGFKTNVCEIFFDQIIATEYAEKHQIDIPNGSMFIGLKNKKPIFIDTTTQMTKDGQSICDLIITELPEDLRTEYMKTRNTKKLMYNTVTIMAQSIPLVILLLYWEGINEVIKKLNLKYRFSKSHPSELASNEQVIRFKDCYFVYEEDLAISLLLNGIKVMDTSEFNIDDYNTTEPYLPYFKKVYGKVSIANVITNYYDFMIDPITEEVLKDIHLPTDIVSLCIYANSLLVDETYTPENSQMIQRVRSTEIIPAILYNELRRSYIGVANTNGKSKLSMPKDCVIKQLLALQTVEDYSTLNPVAELEKDRCITSKGFRGINVDRAYTEEKRSYDDSMIGIIAVSTSPDGNVGINRFLTLEPNIKTARGYVDIKVDKKEDLKDTNIFSPAELLYPLGNTRDDAVRVAMAVKQTKHVIPVKDSIPALITNGADEIVKYELSSDFVSIAEEDGEVIDYDKKSGIMMVKYKSGKTHGIDLSTTIVKNGAGGFYLSNQLISPYKVGDKFKKDDTLAYHKDFFKEDPILGIRMNVGSLTKIAIMSSYGTYNDITMVTHKMTENTSSNVTFCKSVVLGKNSNVYDYKKVGEEIEVGDSLVSFDTSFEDTNLNKLLSNLSDTNTEVLEETSTSKVPSPYAGKIIAMKIYSTVELEELSESLQDIVSNYYKDIEHKKNFVSKYDTQKTSPLVKCGLLLNETTGKIEPNIYGVIKGQKVEDSVLIEYYIEHEALLGIGDKITYFTALKTVVGEVIPEGFEPYSEFRPEEELSALVAPSSIIKRQTPSIFLTVLGNKIIVELKRSLQKIYEE